MTRKTGVFFRAVPDNGKVDAKVTAEGRISLGFPNSFIPSPRIEKLLRENTETLWHGPRVERLPKLPAGSWVVNFCADHDEYSRAMAALSEMVRTSGAPVFNHPDGILKSRRDKVSEVLQGVDGLTVPRCVRFRPADPAEFEAVFAANGFDYPVLVRPTRSQTGHHLVKVDGPEDWQKIHAIPWGGQDLFMTQFTDFRSGEGHYLKIRAVWAGDRLVIRHTLKGDSWLVHAMDRTNEVVDWEFAQHRALYEDPAFVAVAREVKARLGLDFFGIDMGMRGPGDFVLFEANAAMSILSTDHMPEYRRPEFMAILKGVEEGLLVGLRGVQARASRTVVRGTR